MKLTKTKICGSLAVAATIAVFSGCGDESTTNNIDNTAVLAFDADSLPECAKANEGELAFNKTDNTLRICYDTEWYVLNGKDGQKGKTGDQGKKGETGDNGTGCTVKALDDKSGLKLICDGDSLGVVLNGEQGDQGDQGNSCVKCEAVDVTEDGYSIKCDGEVVATILNGSAVPATKSSDSKQTSPASSSSNGVPIAPANSSSSSNGVPIAPANSSSSNAKSSSSDESSSSGFNMGNCPEGTSSPSGYSATVFPDGFDFLGESPSEKTSITEATYSPDCDMDFGNSNFINTWSVVYKSAGTTSQDYDNLDKLRIALGSQATNNGFKYSSASYYGDVHLYYYTKDDGSSVTMKLNETTVDLTVELIYIEQLSGEPSQPAPTQSE